MSTFTTNPSTPTTDGLMFGAHALSNDLSSIGSVSGIKIKGCQARQIFVESDTSLAPTTILPAEWDDKTILLADFAKSISGGNVDFIVDNLRELLFKRRVKNDDSIDAWKTIFRYEINADPEEAAKQLRNIRFKDYLARAGESYEYTIVPVAIVDGKRIEGTIDDSGEEFPSVDSNFEAIIISDGMEHQKLYAGVALGTATNKQLVGIHETLGAKYPIVVSNSNVNYMSGTVSGTVLNQEFYDGNTKFDRRKLVKAREDMQEFLSNKKPKIVKDWNGNIWLTQISDSPTYVFNDSWGAGIADVNLSWVELGSLEDQETLDKFNLVVIIRGDD